MRRHFCTYPHVHLRSNVALLVLNGLEQVCHWDFVIVLGWNVYEIAFQNHQPKAVIITNVNGCTNDNSCYVY